MNLNPQQTYEYIRNLKSYCSDRASPTEVTFALARMSSRKVQTVHLNPYHLAYKYELVISRTVLRAGINVL